MERQHVKTKSFLALFLFGLLMLVPNTGYAEEIRVNLNKERLNFQTQPVIVKGTTFVPMRKIFEELGAEVSWDGEKKLVQGKKDNLLLEIDLNKNKLTLNKRIIPMEKAFILKDGSTLVPLRVISESFKADLVYEKKDGYAEINIFTEDKASLASITNGQVAIKPSINKKVLMDKLGKPDRIDYYSEGISLYVYNNKSKDYKDYIQILVKDTGEVLRIETNAKNWSIDGRIHIGSSYKPGLVKEYNNILKKEGLYLSLHKTYDNKVGFITLESNKMPKELWYENREQNLDKILKSKEDQLFDFTNVIRANAQLKPFDRDPRLDKLAKNHSLDMASKNYMSHTSLEGLKGVDRFNQERLNLYFGGENLTAGHLCPKAAINALYDSSGHRANLLSKSSYMGAGVAYNKNAKYRIYYTQILGRR